MFIVQYDLIFYWKRTPLPGSTGVSGHLLGISAQQYKNFQCGSGGPLNSLLKREEGFYFWWQPLIQRWAAEFWVVSCNMTTVTNLKLKATDDNDANEPQGIPGGGKGTASAGKCSILKDLGNGSQVLYISRFISYQQSWNYFDYLNNNIPWARPTIRVFGRSCVQGSQ